MLYDEENQKHFFPLYKDKDVGIAKEYQALLIDSWNDDDKRTSSTQMRRGMDQTMQDLYEVFGSQSSREKWTWSVKNIKSQKWSFEEYYVILNESKYKKSSII